MEMLRIKEVMKMVGLSRTTIWRRIKSGDFPARRRLGGPNTRVVGWLRADIEDWLASRRPVGDAASPDSDKNRTEPAVQLPQRKGVAGRRPEKSELASSSNSGRNRISHTLLQRQVGSCGQILFQPQGNCPYTAHAGGASCTGAYKTISATAATCGWRKRPSCNAAPAFDVLRACPDTSKILKAGDLAR